MKNCVQVGIASQVLHPPRARSAKPHRDPHRIFTQSSGPPRVWPSALLLRAAVDVRARASTEQRAVLSSTSGGANLHSKHGGLLIVGTQPYIQTAHRMSDPDAFNGAAYASMLEELAGTSVARLKAFAITSFASTAGIAVSDAVDYLLIKQPELVDGATVAAVLRPRVVSEPADGLRRVPASFLNGDGLLLSNNPAGSGSSAGIAGVAPPIAQAAPIGQSVPSRAQLLERQRALLQPYGKEAKAKQLAGLRGAPDPKLAPGAIDVLIAGGPAAEQLKEQHKLWLEAQEDKGKKATMPPPPKELPPRLQFTAYFIEATDEELEVKQFSEQSAKLRDSDSIYSAISQVLLKHGGDLSMNDLVMLDADKPNIKLWSSNDVEHDKAIDLFAGKSVERVVFLAPLSCIQSACKLIKAERLKDSPVHGGGARAATGKRQREGNEPDRRGHNLYVQWKRLQSTSGWTAEDTKQAFAEWTAMGEEGKQAWLKDHGHEAPVKKPKNKRGKRSAALALSEGEDEGAEAEGEDGAEGGAEGGAEEEGAQVAAGGLLALGSGGTAACYSCNLIPGCTLGFGHKGVCIPPPLNRGDRRK
jgi:hypothetical protein